MPWPQNMEFEGHKREGDGGRENERQTSICSQASSSPPSLPAALVCCCVLPPINNLFGPSFPLFLSPLNGTHSRSIFLYGVVQQKCSELNYVTRYKSVPMERPVPSPSAQSTPSCLNKAELMRCYPRPVATDCGALQFINFAHPSQPTVKSPK